MLDVVPERYCHIKKPRRSGAENEQTFLREKVQPLSRFDDRGRLYGFILIRVHREHILG